MNEQIDAGGGDVFIHPLAEVKSEHIGKGTRIWQFVVVSADVRIGEQCNICSHCFIEDGVSIGNRVTIKSGVFLWRGVTLADDVFVGPNVSFTNDKYPRSGNRDFQLLHTAVGRGASLGAGAVILPGVRIGQEAIVGAGAVVTKDVPDGASVRGNPAR